MDEYYNLFLGVWTAVSLFLVVQHVGLNLQANRKISLR